MTNLQWIQKRASATEIARMLDRLPCETCAYEKHCTMADIHYARLDCHTGIVEWLNQKRNDINAGETVVDRDGWLYTVEDAAIDGDGRNVVLVRKQDKEEYRWMPVSELEEVFYE